VKKVGSLLIQGYIRGYWAVNKRKAFTLVELLVVIAIIALLMAILMPALSRVKRQARASACLAELKQWSLYFSMYVDEHNGKFMQGFNGVAKPPPGRSNDNRWVQALGPYYKWDSKITCCPEATRPWYTETGEDMHLAGTHLGSTTAWGYYQLDACPKPIKGSFGINGWCNNPDPLSGHYPGPPKEEWHWRTPYVKGAGYVPLLVGAQRYNLWPESEDAPPAVDGQYWGDVTHIGRVCLNRHDGFVNALFMDWSARKVGIKELWTLKWHRTYNTADHYTRAGGVRPADWPQWMRHFPDY